uniref:Uncharacterized protein n=1 Tax=Aegilops tauschii subsp. strangulata TaxID=200361 RepID=A0A453K8J5_AEGTS
MIPAGCIPEACTSVGAAKYGRPIGLDEVIKVDLIVIGSVAVDPSTGARLGKGECCFFNEETVGKASTAPFSFHKWRTIQTVMYNVNAALKLNCALSTKSRIFSLLICSLSMDADHRDLQSWNMGCFVIWEL